MTRVPSSSLLVATAVASVFALLAHVVLPRAAAQGDAGVASAVATADAGSVDGGVPDAAVVPGPTDGLYRLQDAAAVDAAMNASIEAAIAGLHPSMRDPFRAQLRASLRAPRAIRIQRRTETLVLTYDGTAFTARIGGATATQPGVEGRPVQVTHREESGALVQEVRNGQFRRTDRLAVGATEAVPVSAVSVSTELRTGLLPRPLVLTATYARAGVTSDGADAGSTP